MSVLYDIQAEIAASQRRIAQTEFSLERQKELNDEIQKYGEMRRTAITIREAIFQSAKAAKQYISEKEKHSLASVDRSIRGANSIVCSVADGIHLDTSGNSARLVDSEGIDVFLLEGGAYNATLSFFFRDAILQNTSYLPFMLMDEAFATLSADTSAVLSDLIAEISKRTQVIVIEQKPEISAGGSICDVTLTFRKFDWKTEVMVEWNSLETQSVPDTLPMATDGD